MRGKSCSLGFKACLFLIIRAVHPLLGLRQPCCPALGWGALRRRDLQSLSEITSPKALDEIRRLAGDGAFSIGKSANEDSSQQGCFAESGSRAARSPRAFGRIHPLPSSLQT
jgi:hypothetical protein